MQEARKRGYYEFYNDLALSVGKHSTPINKLQVWYLRLQSLLISLSIFTILFDNDKK